MHEFKIADFKVAFFYGSAPPNTEKEFSVHKNPIAFLVLGVAVALIILKDRKIFLLSVLSLDV